MILSARRDFRLSRGERLRDPMAKDIPTKKKSWRVFAVLGIVAGGALVGFELQRFGLSGPPEVWFWIVVGVLLIALGLAEFLTTPPKGE
jgi:hypothetical protein